MNPTLTPRRRMLASIGAALACTLLAACGSNTAGAQQSPTPAGLPSTEQTTPTPGQPSSPSSSPSTNDLTHQAEAVYRQQFDLVFATYKAGGIPPGTPPPSRFKDLFMDRALADTMAELGQVATQRLKYKSGQTVIRAVTKSQKEMADSVVALHSCEDGQSLTSILPNGRTEHGRLIDMTSYYAWQGSRLKMIYFLGKAVKSCTVD